MNHSPVHCPRCFSEEKVKAGFIKDHQRFRCKVCGHFYTGPVPREATPQDKQLAIDYFHQGISLGEISRKLGFSRAQIWRWVQTAKDNLLTHNHVRMFF